MDSAKSKNRWFRWGKLALQGAILCLVIWGVWRTVAQAHGTLLEQGIAWNRFDYRFLALAAVLYLGGMFPCAVFWQQVMGAMQQKVPWGEAISAYFVSQLGKYVPGKVMVLVIRTGLVRHHGVNYTLTVASIFVETLTMMSVGAMLGALLLVFSLGQSPSKRTIPIKPQDSSSYTAEISTPEKESGNTDTVQFSYLSPSIDWRLIVFAVVAAAAVGAPTLPPVFMRIVKVTKLHRLHPEIDQSLAGLNWHLLWPGWVAIAFGWVVMGLSMWAVLQAIPGVNPKPSLPHDLPILIACVTLSTVAGFVSGLPGGIGARELVVFKLVELNFGSTAAILSAIVHRCVMLVAELIAAGVLFLLTKAQRPAPPH